MAARINGQPTLIAMKAVASGEKRPQDYSTPAGGSAHFDFVGEVPDSRLQLLPHAHGRGYSATFAVPRAFIEFDWQPGRGLQATERRYLFTPRVSSTTMADDVPTEARLYPHYWGKVEVK